MLFSKTCNAFSCSPFCNRSLACICRYLWTFGHFCKLLVSCCSIAGRAFCCNNKDSINILALWKSGFNCNALVNNCCAADKREASTSRLADLYSCSVWVLTSSCGFDLTNFCGSSIWVSSAGFVSSGSWLLLSESTVDSSCSFGCSIDFAIVCFVCWGLSAVVAFTTGSSNSTDTLSSLLLTGESFFLIDVEVIFSVANWVLLSKTKR